MMLMMLMMILQGTPPRWQHLSSLPMPTVGVLLSTPWRMYHQQPALLP